MYIDDSFHNHYNSLNLLNQYNNFSEISQRKKYKNSRSKILINPINSVYHNYNSISELKFSNSNNKNNERKIPSFNINNDLKTYNFPYYSYNSVIKNNKIKHFESCAFIEPKSDMNIMSNNGIIKKIYVNKNPKFNINNSNNNNFMIQNYSNYNINNINKIKKNFYNDYNLTFQDDKPNNKAFRVNSNSNLNSVSKNIKIFTYKSLNDKKLLKNISYNTDVNKIIQIPIENNNLNFKNSNSYRKNFYKSNLNATFQINKENNNINNNIMNQNKKNKIYQKNNFYSKTNIYETRNGNLRDQICLFSQPSNYTKNKKNISSNKTYSNLKDNVNETNTNCTPIIKHQSFNKEISSTNKKQYQITEIKNFKNIQNNLISSSSSDSSDELSDLAEVIIKIRKNEKKFNINNKCNLKDIYIKPNNKLNNKQNENNLKINSEKDDNEKKNKEIKNKILNDSTEENFDLIDKIINKADEEEKNKKNRSIIFDMEKNKYINYNLKEKVNKNDKKMEFYLTLLKSKTKFNPVIKSFDVKDIKINKDYFLNENLEEYEMLGDLYNIFYLKDINDLDKKLKNNIDNLIQNKKFE